MCGGVEARDAVKTYKVYFPSPKAAIPVLGAGGEDLGWVRWGGVRASRERAPKAAGQSLIQSNAVAG